jgi:hypothetical protein
LCRAETAVGRIADKGDIRPEHGRSLNGRAELLPRPIVRVVRFEEPAMLQCRESVSCRDSPSACRAMANSMPGPSVRDSRVLDVQDSPRVVVRRLRRPMDDQRPHPHNAAG